MLNEIHDRGMIKWQPFDSITSTKKMCYDILKERNYETPPILSEDQLEIIEETILNSYYNKDKVKIAYYYNGSILNKETKIKYIDKIKKQIICSDAHIIHFKQIIKIKNN
jgi:hypothetical protein